MPQLPDRFSAYPVTVTLDGSGGGTIRFQAVGKNIVITNLYVSVATQTAQAKCTTYKQQVGPQWAIGTTNSGSTGASAAGRIELLDGEAVYVVWTGGDANAVATATFSGMVLPFSVKPESGTDFVWADPIAAGDGTLVYPALQSVGYQTGVQGWRIDRNGNAEFNNGSFRGSVIVTSTNPSSVGSKVSIIPGGASDIIFTPPASVTGLTTSNGAIDHSLIDSAINGEEDLTLSSGQVNGLGQSVITMRSANVNGTPAYVQVVPNFAVAGDATVTGLTKASRWMAGVGTNSGGPPVGAVESIALIASTASGPATFKAGRAYKFELWGSFVTSVNNTDILFRIRKENGTNNPPTGQILSAGRKTGRVLAVTYDAGLTGYFIVGATDVTCDISLCIIGTASNVNLSAGATFPAEFNIYDAGDATNHNFAAVLV